MVGGSERDHWKLTGERTLPFQRDDQSRSVPLRQWRRTLPMMPPSCNTMYKQVRIRGKPYDVRKPTAKLMAFKRSVVPYLRSTLPVFNTTVSIAIIIWGGRGWIESSDVSNRIKAAEDALVDAGRVPDDNCRHIKGGRWWYYDRREHCESRGIKATTANRCAIEALCVLVVTELEPPG